MKLVLAFLALAAAAAPARAGAPSFKKIVVVVFENTSEDDAFQRPFFGKLANQGAALKNYYAVTHPSQPNYIAMVSGSDDLQLAPEKNEKPANRDGVVNIDRRHLGDLLEEAGLRWKVYAQRYPGNCFLGEWADDKKYARKHVPFISFKNVQSSPKRCANVVEGSQFFEDFKSGALPEYSLFIPDMRNDGHNTGVKFADHWFSDAFGELIKDPAFEKDILLAVTFDEDDRVNANHIYTALYGASVAPGSVSKERYTHYSLLKTIEKAFKLGSLGLNDDGAKPIDDVWK
jgi:phospholipase C